MKIKKLNELNSNDLNITAIKPNVITFKSFKLDDLLKGLEKERPGITKRVNKFIYDESDPYFLPQDVRGLYDLPGRLYSLNLFYYGVGDEYPLKYTKQYPDEVEHSKGNHPEAFMDGTEDESVRLDFNLIWSVYEDYMDDSVQGGVENFLVTT